MAGEMATHPRQTLSEASTLLHSLPEAQHQAVFEDIFFHCFTDHTVHTHKTTAVTQPLGTEAACE